ncbi:MAG: hypothetical protein Fur0039_23870 [Rhodocyclaceae bacterium]
MNKRAFAFAAGIALAAPAAAGISALDAALVPLITVADSPANHLVTAPTWLDGVAKLVIVRSDGTFGCSGSLIGSGDWVLTAAHCITGASSATVTFAQASGAPSLSASAFFVNPGWNGVLDHGGDLGLIRLAAAAPAAVTRYDILRDASITGITEAVLAGYGISGTGNTGNNAGTYPFGTLRSGINRLDTVYSFIPGEPFAFDFDNGSTAQDAIGQLTSGLLADLGLGANEVLTAPGDSGGPSFYGTLIAGVHSFGATVGPPIDIRDNFVDGSFGELGGDTRTAAYASWIDSVTAVPEPSTWAMMLAGLVLLGAGAARRTR